MFYYGKNLYGIKRWDGCVEMLNIISYINNFKRYDNIDGVDFDENIMI